MRISQTLSVLLISLTLLVPALVQAQTPLPEGMSLEMQQALNYAKGLMADEDYEGANRTFRQLLKSGEVLPDDLAYLFSETLFMLGQYQNSRNFLNKYLEVTGTRRIEIRHAPLFRSVMRT